MDLCPLLEDQVRIQADAIALWKKWMCSLVLAGVAILVAGQFRWFPGAGPSGGEIVKVGGIFVGLLAAFPYRETVPRKERLATYQFLLVQLRSFDTLCAADQNALLLLANDALKETIKR